MKNLTLPKALVTLDYTGPVWLDEQNNPPRIQSLAHSIPSSLEYGYRGFLQTPRHLYTADSAQAIRRELAVQGCDLRRAIPLYLSLWAAKTATERKEASFRKKVEFIR